MPNEEKERGGGGGGKELHMVLRTVNQKDLSSRMNEDDSQKLKHFMLQIRGKLITCVPFQPSFSSQLSYGICALNNVSKQCIQSANRIEIANCKELVLPEKICLHDQACECKLQSAAQKLAPFPMLRSF